MRVLNDNIRVRNNCYSSLRQFSNHIVSGVVSQLIYAASGAMPQMIVRVNTGYTLKVKCENATTVITGATGVNQTVDHTFSAAGTVTFTGDLDQWTYIQWRNSANIQGSISDAFKCCTALKQVKMSSTGVTGDLSFVSANLNVLDLSATSIVSDLNHLSSATGLTQMTFISTTGLSYTSTTLPNWDNCTINISGVGLDQTESDNWLIDIDAQSVASTKTLTMTGNTAPSGAGITAKNSLIAKGWTVNTD